MAMTPPASTARPLAQQLLRTRGQGIAVFVQERVHSTTVGLAATTAFVQQLLAELESAVGILNLTEDTSAPFQLSDEEEVELGTLISASSLTIRYVTERDAMTPVLDRFDAAFQLVLRFPVWTKALLGLKMVALMGSTRLLESFGDHMSLDQVVGNILWLFSQFPKTADAYQDDFTQRVNYLFRPACEHLTVAIQSHPMCHQTVYDKIVPLLFNLASALDETVTDAVASELLATIAVILDLRLPSPNKSAFSLLPLPDFALDQSSTDDDNEENIHILQRENGTNSERPVLSLPGSAVVEEFTTTLVGWIGMEGRRRGVISNLPHICGALAVAQQGDSLAVVCRALLSSLQLLVLDTKGDFEYFLATIECVRDLGLRDAIPEGLEQTLYLVLREIMPRLQAALKSLPVDVANLRSIKSTCSTIREALVEAFVCWIHFASQTDVLAQVCNEFTTTVIDKLADPRVYGDLLFASRRFLDGPSIAATVEVVVAPVLKAIKQLDRYSKVAGGRILSGVARLAIGAGAAIVPHVDSLAAPLLRPITEGSRKGKTARLNAVGCLLLSSASEASFSLEGHDWIYQFANILIEDCASRNVHGMNILVQLAQFDPTIRAFIANTVGSRPEALSHVVHNTLSSWPIFVEDMDAVMLVLATLSNLLVEDGLRTAVDIGNVTIIVSKLRENAQADDEADIVEACDEALKTLSGSSAE